MAGGDRTGPIGAGPMTGRGAGYCARFDMPGYANNQVTGFGRRRRGGWGRGNFAPGMGFRRGGGWDFNRWATPPVAAPAPANPADQLNRLKAQAQSLQAQLQNLTEQIDQLTAE